MNYYSAIASAQRCRDNIERARLAGREDRILLWQERLERAEDVIAAHRANPWNKPHPTPTEKAERKQRLLLRYQSGETLEQIAATEGVTRERIRQILGHDGRVVVGDRRSKTAQIEAERQKTLAEKRAARRKLYDAAIAAVASGRSVYDVAHEYNIMSATLYAQLQKAGVNPPALAPRKGFKKNRVKPFRFETVQRLRAEGKGWKEIAGHLTSIGDAVKWQALRTWCYYKSGGDVHTVFPLPEHLSGEQSKQFQ